MRPQKLHTHGSSWRAAPPSTRHHTVVFPVTLLTFPTLLLPHFSLVCHHRRSSDFHWRRACTRSLTHVIPLSSCDARSASHLRVSPSQAHCSVSPSPRQGPKGCACIPGRARCPQHSNQCAPQRIASHHMPRMPYQRRSVCVIMVPRAIHMGPVAGIPYIARELSKRR